MAVKRINKDLCNDCELRKEKGCPVADSCSVDVIRLDEEGKPFVAYPGDCHSCFLCERDCPLGAIEVSAEIPLPVLPY